MIRSRTSQALAGHMRTAKYDGYILATSYLHFYYSVENAGLCPSGGVIVLGIRVERCVDAHSGVKDSVFILVDRAAFVEHRRNVSVREATGGLAVLLAWCRYTRSRRVVSMSVVLCI